MKPLFTSNRTVPDIDRLRLLPICHDQYESSLKNTRSSSALPLSYRRSQNNNLFGSLTSLPMLSSSRCSLPMSSFSLPPLSSHKNRHSIFDKYIQNTPHSPIIQKSSIKQQQSNNVHQPENCNDEDLMGLCYRFLPDHFNYINQEFYITKELKERLTYICNTLGLSSNSVPFSIPELFTYSRKGAGMRSLVNEEYDKVLVEVLTFFKGKYGRFLLLVSLGVCCTVWYALVPGMHDIAPPSELFPSVLSYNKFFQVDNHYDQFQKVCFIEKKYLTGDVLSAFENEFPFSDMNIPANNNVRVAVGLGVMVAVFLAMGIVPNVSSINNISEIL